jgi:hypothetical protein
MRKRLKTKLTRARLFLLALAIAWPGCSLAAAKQQIYNLPLPKAAGSGEALVARVSVGPLKPHERIIVRTGNGEIAGTISPYGAQARQSGAVYTIPIPASGAKDNEVRLLVEVERKGAETRAPTAQELLDIKLVWVPVTKYGSKE